MNMPPATSAPPALQAVGLGVRLGQTPVLQGLDIALRPGCWTSIVGPNGAGKSTLLRALAGLLPHAGRVQWHGQDRARIPARARAQQLAWLGQSEAAADDLGVMDLVLLGRLPHQAWLAGPNAQDWAAVERALRATHMWEQRGRSLGQLSGGERQRALLARALAVEASVLLMDEPLANLDPPHQSDWLCIVQSLVDQGVTVVSVLHELTMALYADELVLMQSGQVAHHGRCDAPATHRALEAVFDQRIAVLPVAGQWVAVPRGAAHQRRAQP